MFSSSVCLSNSSIDHPVRRSLCSQSQATGKRLAYAFPILSGFCPILSDSHILCTHRFCRSKLRGDKSPWRKTRTKFQIRP